MNLKVTTGLKALLLAALLSGSNSARAEIAIFGGLHGAGLSHYKTTLPGGATDPVKGGLIGISNGYQVGLDMIAGPIWFQPQYDMDYAFVGNYTTGTYFDRRYDNPGLILPIMYRKVIAGFSLGAGIYYRYKLSDEADSDAGFSFAMKKPLKGKLFWNAIMQLGVRESPEQANRQQIGLGIGINLK